MISGKTIVYEDAATADKAVYIAFDKQHRKSFENLPWWLLYLKREEAVGPWESVRDGAYNHIHVPKGTVTKIFEI